MTQPNEAVGGANDEPIIAAEPTIEDRFAALTEQPVEEEAETPVVEAEAEQAPEAVEQEAEEAPEEGELPPIQPPVSWTAEEKEEFNSLPRALQETLTRRESEREKFVQAKAQEAKQTRSAVEREALQAIQQINGTYAQQLQALLPQVPQRPSHQLQAEDPYAYAEQMDAYEYAVAQHQFVQQQLQIVGQRQQQAQQQMTALANQETEALLKDQFPEYLDPEQRPKLQEKLSAAAIRLGYTQDQLANVDGRDILAMREVANLLEKAEKYDALMKQKMATVRSAKDLPRVSKPGQPVGKGAVANQRYTADRAAMRNGDKAAEARVFKHFL